jgi:hypothetical protein
LIISSAQATVIFVQKGGNRSAVLWKSGVGGPCEWPAAVLLYSPTEMTAPDPGSQRRVLLVEDDDILRRNYEALLSAHRLTVCGCATKLEAIDAFNRERFDVVILDVTLAACRT